MGKFYLFNLKIWVAVEANLKLLMRVSKRLLICSVTDLTMITLFTNSELTLTTSRTLKMLTRVEYSEDPFSYHWVQLAREARREIKLTISKMKLRHAMLISSTVVATTCSTTL